MDVVILLLPDPRAVLRGSDEGGGSRVAAGYVTSYGGASVNPHSEGMVFLTIKGSGHEVRSPFFV